MTCEERTIGDRSGIKQDVSGVFATVRIWGGVCVLKGLAWSLSSVQFAALSFKWAAVGGVRARSLRPSS